MAARPASMMKIDSTAAKIGRSMKKRENMLLLLRRRFAFAFRLLLGNLHRSTGPELHEPVHDHFFARLQAVQHHPVGARPLAELDRARLRDPLLADDVDEL